MKGNHISNNKQQLCILLKRYKKANKNLSPWDQSAGVSFCQAYGKDYSENYSNRYKQGVTMHHREISGIKQSICSIGESTSQASAMHRLDTFWGVTSSVQSACHSWSPVVSWEVEFCWGRVLRFWRVILHGEAGWGIHSHLREAGLTQLWFSKEQSATFCEVHVSRQNNNKRASPMRL
jgi:hypothetical protein